MKRKALVIEDIKHNRILMRTILEMQKFEVTELDHGREAIEVATKLQPDIILLDIQLPEIDGIQIVEMLKQKEETRLIPVVAVTAFAMKRDRERILAAGCNDYLAKPFRSDELIEIVNKYVQGTVD